MYGRSTATLRQAAAIAIVGLAGIAGCESQQTTTSRTNGGPLATTITLYERGDYENAEREASQIANLTAGRTRGEAAYIAGLAAYEQGKPVAAEGHLLMASRSSDSDTTGRANAMLGIIALNDKRNVEAAAFFDRASEHLTGRQRDQARRYANVARRNAGSTVHTASTTPSGRFCLQAGAFRDRSRADKTSRELEPLAANAGLGSVRISQRQLRPPALSRPDWRFPHAERGYTSPGSHREARLHRRQLRHLSRDFSPIPAGQCI